MVNVIVKDGEKIMKDVTADVTCVITLNKGFEKNRTFLCGEASEMGIAVIPLLATQVLDNIKDKKKLSSTAIALIKAIARDYLDEKGKFIAMRELAKEKGKRSRE